MNRAPLLALAAVVTALAVLGLARASENPGEWVVGDADCGGSVNAIDAALILQASAGLLDAPPCRRAADVNNDYGVDSLDALLTLQHQAGLIGLAVREVQLCPFGGKGIVGDIEVAVDLDGDGTAERLAIRLDTEAAQTVFELSARNDGTGAYEIVASETFMALPDTGPAGPYTYAASVDVNEDGTNEAVLCSTQWGANDPFTNVAVFSYEGGVAATLYRGEWLPWAFVSMEDRQLVVTTRYDWFAGACETIVTQYNRWDGSRFVLARERVFERFRDPGCDVAQPGGPLAGERPPEADLRPLAPLRKLRERW